MQTERKLILTTEKDAMRLLKFRQEIEWHAFLCSSYRTQILIPRRNTNLTVK